MKTVSTFLFCLTVLPLSFSCEEETPVILDIESVAGDYSGIFNTLQRNGPDTSNPVNVILSLDGRFLCSGNGFNPAGGSGSFELAGETIIFTDSIAVRNALITSDLILTGEFTYTWTEDRLTLYRQNRNADQFFYELMRN